MTMKSMSLRLVTCNCTLQSTNIATEKRPFKDGFLKLVIFHGYVSLPEVFFAASIPMILGLSTKGKNKFIRQIPFE